MKIRIGMGLGGAAGPDGLTAVTAQLERLGVDSLWLSEMVYGPLAEPFIGMTWALATTSKLKVGTGVTVLPGRHPVLVAKQLATLAGLAPARVLPVFGLRPARPAERDLFPVPDGQRAAVFDESLALVRALLTQPSVTFEGPRGGLTEVNVADDPRVLARLKVGETYRFTYTENLAVAVEKVSPPR